MKLYEALASVVADEAIESVFGLMGDGNMSFWGALARQNATKIYSARNEAGAVAMADGYFRGTGKLSLATVTCGPGLTQVGTSLVAAARNRTPLVLMIGAAPARDPYNLQRFDQRRFVEACEARHFPVRTLDTAAEDMSEAFYAARINRCPVVLDLPIDLQEQEINWDWFYRSSLEFIPEHEAASDADIERLYQAIVAAERPIIVAGAGARNPTTKRAVLKLAELTGALLATSLQGKGLFEGEEYDIGISGSFVPAPSEHLFGEADFILAVGAELGLLTSEGGLLFPEARVARIDIMPPRHLGVLPGLHVKGDAAKTVPKLVQLLLDRKHSRTGFRTSETRAILSQPFERPSRSGSDGLDARLLMRELSYAIPPNAMVTCGGGHFMGIVAMSLPLPPDTAYHSSTQFGAIGQTLPVAIGMGVGNPDKPHIMIEGDGSIMMNMQELETVARHRIPMVIVILNDGAYGAEAHKLKKKGFDPSLAQWDSPDFVALARSFGGDGQLLANEQEIRGAVARGLATKGLFIIDARISDEMSDAYKKVHFGQPNSAPLLRYEKAGSVSL